MTVVQGSDKVSVGDIQIDASAGTVTFKLTGNTKSDSKLDVEIKVASGNTKGTKKATVLIPDKCGAPRPMDADVPATVQNLAINEDTAPAWPGLKPPKFALICMLNLSLEVQILDQFGDPLKCYAGSKVDEKVNGSAWANLNVTLDAGGKYVDNCGFARGAPNPPNTPNPADETIPAQKTMIDTWKAGSGPAPTSGGSAPGGDTIEVEIDDTWTIPCGTRTMSWVDQTKIHVLWP